MIPSISIVFSMQQDKNYSLGQKIWKRNFVEEIMGTFFVFRFWGSMRKIGRVEVNSVCLGRKWPALIGEYTCQTTSLSTLSPDPPSISLYLPPFKHGLMMIDLFCCSYRERRLLHASRSLWYISLLFKSWK